MKRSGKKIKIAAVVVLAFILALALALCAGAASKNKKNKTTEQYGNAAQQATLPQENGNGKENLKETAKKDTQKETGEKGAQNGKEKGASEQAEISEDGEYYSKDDVALYIHLYEHLPDNYITKNEAKELGWVSSKGNLWDVAPGRCIGGDNFGNREGLLPEKKGRKYYECDVDYEGGYRTEDRLIYSNDGLVYYTGDHYNSFELMYGEE